MIKCGELMYNLNLGNVYTDRYTYINTQIITTSLHRQTSHDFKDSVHTNTHTVSEALNGRAGLLTPLQQ